MDAEIGVAAGEIHRFLEVNGPASAAQLKKATGCKDKTIHQAIGWLAREDKVVRLTRGKAVRWSLA